MSDQIGTIVELNPIDALGWIELDAGGRVRFGGTSCKGFGKPPGVGSRVIVRGVQPGFRGVPKAVEVAPYVTPEEAAAEEEEDEDDEEAEGIPWPDFVRAHPRWSDVAEVCVPCARPAARPVLPEHPLFAPWHREICDTAPTEVPLSVPDYRTPDPIDPGPSDSFAYGRTAYLEEPVWPSCGRCGRPMRVCLQLSPAVMADFVPGGRGLVALLCFECAYGNRVDPKIGHVRLVVPRHRVVGPDAFESDDQRQLESQTRRVTAGAPRAVLPDGMWHRYRSEKGTDYAGSALLGFDDESLCGPFPEGVDPDDLADISALYDDWVKEQPGNTFGGAYLGGAPSWDQWDATPACEHGEMLHLLDYNGGQFLDGALHVFACREWRCDLAFVPEF